LEKGLFGEWACGYPKLGIFWVKTKKKMKMLTLDADPSLGHVLTSISPYLLYMELIRVVKNILKRYYYYYYYYLLTLNDFLKRLASYHFKA